MREAYKNVTDKEPGASVNISRSLRNLKNALRSQNGNQDRRTIPDSASNTFMLVMQALASLGEDFDIDIASLRVSPQDAKLVGSIPSLLEDVELDQAIKKHPQLHIESWGFEPLRGERRPFDMNINVIKTVANTTGKDRK
jgi:hypothetical protein